MRFDVDLLFHPEQDHYHAAAIQAGVHALARNGVIRLRYTRDPADRSLTANPIVTCLRVRTEGDGPPRVLALDLHDRSDLFDEGVLERCDLYFKRSMYRPDAARLPGPLAVKLRPFGLNHPCRSAGSTSRLLRAAVWHHLLRGRAGLRRLYHHLVLPRVTDFEQLPDAPVEPTVVFQTRVWEPHETGVGEHEAINEGRVATIRALRAAFGDRFRGGLVPTPLARSLYPNDLTPHPTRRARYIALSKRSLVAVYTRGLHQSTAFKLAEGLAASQCVVAEPPRNELPAPLVPGTHYLPFVTPDECVAACERLFREGPPAAAMRAANHAYYRAEVEPAAHMLRVLEVGCIAEGV